MINWRILENCLVESTSEITLGAMAKSILGKAERNFNNTGWRNRPLLAAIGLRRYKNKLIDLDSLLDAMNEPMQASMIALELVPNATTWKYINRLKTGKNIYWGDITLLDGLIDKMNMPPWVQECRHLDELLARKTYFQAPLLPFWSDIARTGLQQLQLEHLFALNQLALLASQVLLPPASIELLFGIPETTERLVAIRNELLILQATGIALPLKLPAIATTSDLTRLEHATDLIEYAKWSRLWKHDMHNRLLLGEMALYQYGEPDNQNWILLDIFGNYSGSPQILEILMEQAPKDEEEFEKMLDLLPAITYQDEQGEIYEWLREKPKTTRRKNISRFLLVFNQKEPNERPE